MPIPDPIYQRAIDTGFLPEPAAPFGSNALPNFGAPSAAPSQNFAPVMAAIAAGGPPSPLQGMPDRWPTYQNTDDATVAQAQGIYNPNYASPRAELLAQSRQVVQNQNQAFQQQQYQQGIQRAQQARSQYTPVIGADGTLQNPQQLLSTQTGADPSGTIAKILRSLQGGGTGQTPLQPYYPQGGYGRIDTQSNALDPLDRTTFNDPVFQQELVRNPDKAKYAYQVLHNRSLDSDLQASNDFRKKQIDTGYQYASNAIQQGAVFDPINRSWKVWNETPPSTDGLTGLNGTPKATRQLVDASPDQNRWLNTFHKGVTTTDLPAPPPQASTATMSEVNRLQKVPEVQAAIAARSKSIGRDLTPQEKQIEAAKAMNDRATAAEAVTRNQSQMPQMLQDTAKAIVGYKPDNTSNWLGKLLESIGSSNINQFP